MKQEDCAGGDVFKHFWPSIGRGRWTPRFSGPLKSVISLKSIWKRLSASSHSTNRIDPNPMGDAALVAARRQTQQLLEQLKMDVAHRENDRDAYFEYERKTD
jgi:hypothetical protein